MRYIYALKDPRDGAIRYVGKANDPKHRLENRLCPGNLLRKKHSSQWLALLKRLGLKPILTILQVVPDTENWETVERAWIAALVKRGCNLTNITKGGEGGATLRGRQLGKTQSTVVRIRSSIRHRGMKMPKQSSEVLKQRGASIKAHWDRVRAEGGRKKGPVHTEETKEKLRVNHNPKSNLNLTGRSPGFRSVTREFSDEQIREIRQRVASGQLQTLVAELFGTCQSVISSIVLRRTYRDVQ